MHTRSSFVVRRAGKSKLRAIALFLKHLRDICLSTPSIVCHCLAYDIRRARRKGHGTMGLRPCHVSGQTGKATPPDYSTRRVHEGFEISPHGITCRCDIFNECDIGTINVINFHWGCVHARDMLCHVVFGVVIVGCNVDTGTRATFAF